MLPKYMKPIFALFCVFVLLYAGACKKQKILTEGGILSFSTDTLAFDTVFTAAGSFTSGMLIYNNQNEAVIISSITMKQGSASYFHLNVDGFSGNTLSNLKIPANDSIYVFATVNIDPTNALTPFIITDSLVATMNGNTYYVPFTAYGQNARYVVDSILTGNVVWDTTLPYVVVKSAQIAPTATLTINAGARVYMHQNSGLIVLGKLLVNGTKTDSVIFQGDRLDRAYFGFRGYPGEWGGIYIDSRSNGSKLTYTQLLNCGNAALGGYASAIWVAPDSINFNNRTAIPQLTLDHTVVQNSIGYGLLSFTGSVVATNCLFNSTGAQGIAIFKGGFDSFLNCTIANYSNYALSHNSTPTMSILNWLQVAQDSFEYADLHAHFRNCIVYGSLDSEIVCDTSYTPVGRKASLTFEHCILKLPNILQPFVNLVNCRNQDPLFKDASNKDYRPKSGSPAANNAHPSILPLTDLDGKNRTTRDIGCYNVGP